jgi:hypothetical protein
MAIFILEAISKELSVHVSNPLTYRVPPYCPIYRKRAEPLKFIFSYPVTPSLVSAIFTHNSGFAVGDLFVMDEGVTVPFTCMVGPAIHIYTEPFVKYTVSSALYPTKLL